MIPGVHLKTDVMSVFPKSLTSSLYIFQCMVSSIDSKMELCFAFVLLAVIVAANFHAAGKYLHVFFFIRYSLKETQLSVLQNSKPSNSKPPSNKPLSQNIFRKISRRGLFEDFQ